MSEIHWTQQASFPLLATLQLLPLGGALLVYYLREHRSAIHIGRTVALLVFVLAVVLYRQLDIGSAQFQLAERVQLLGALVYHAAADGITVLFVLLTALLTFILTLYVSVRGLEKVGHLAAVVLAVEAVLISMLVTVNLLWFVLASAVELGLVGYVLWRWASTVEKNVALVRFYQFQGTGLLLLLLGTMIVGWNFADVAGRGWSFELFDLASVVVRAPLGSVVFFLLFYGLAVRTPLFPMHGWLPIVAHYGNVSVAPILLLGIKVGLYGMVRFVFPLLPDAVQEWHTYVVGFAVAGVFYAAFLAFLQGNLRRLMAFAVVSHTSLAVIGLFTLHHVALQGALMLAVNFGLAAATMLLMIGFVYRRTRTTTLARLGGLFDRIPFVGVTFLIGGLAIVAMPGTPGFDAAHLVMEAAIGQFGALPTVAAALGNVVAAGFLLRAFQQAFLAPPAGGKSVSGIPRAEPMEIFIAGLVVAVLLINGFYLEPWMELIDAPLRELSARFAAMH